jgi:hypothetical protein
MSAIEDEVDARSVGTHGTSDDGWLVFARNPAASRHGLVRSKKGVWWKRLDNEEDATALRKRLGPRAWTAPISQMRRKPREPCPKPAQAELNARQMQRCKALADFAAGRDAPPWEDEPIGDGRT